MQSLLNYELALALGLEQACSTQQWLWFSDKLNLVKNSNNVLQDIQISLAMTKRKVGHIPLANATADFASKHWRSDEAARVLLIATAMKHSAITKQTTSTKEFITILFQQGDEYEKEAILKGLSLLDSQGELVTLAEDSCRTNIITLFTAISQNNRYPAHYFNEGIYNQMVLKSLFLDINIETILGLRGRVNANMSRMCFDYARERIAAGRRVPASIWLTIHLTLLPQALPLFKQYIADENKLHRYYIVLSLSWQQPILADEFTNDITKRIDEETDAATLTLLKILLQ